MQTQDAPADIIFKIWPWLEANRNRLIGGVVAGFIVVGAYSFISWRHDQKEINAGEALSQLLATPATSQTAGQMADSLVKFAAQNPGTGAGERKGVGQEWRLVKAQNSNQQEFANEHGISNFRVLSWAELAARRPTSRLLPGIRKALRKPESRIPAIC